MERFNTGVVAEHVGREPTERPLRPDLDEHPGPCFVEPSQPLDELHRGGHLPGEQIEHLGHGPGPVG